MRVGLRRAGLSVVAGRFLMRRVLARTFGARAAIAITAAPTAPPAAASTAPVFAISRRGNVRRFAAVSFDALFRVFDLFVYFLGHDFVFRLIGGDKARLDRNRMAARPVFGIAHLLGYKLTPNLLGILEGRVLGGSRTHQIGQYRDYDGVRVGLRWTF